MKLDVHIAVIAMGVLMCEGIVVDQSEDEEDIEASHSKYVFSGHENGFKLYDTIGGSFEPFIKADGFESSGARSNYGFNHPIKYAFGNIDKGTFGVQSSLRHLGGQDSDPSNIGGFDYAGHDGTHVKGNFARHHGLPRRPGYYKMLKNKLDYGVSNILPISSLGRNNWKKLTGTNRFTDNVLIPRLRYGRVSTEIAGDGSNYAFNNISSYEDEEEAEASEKLAKGYKVGEDFDKSEREAVEKSHRSGYRGHIDDSKKSEEEENQKYVKNESTANGSSGENYGKNETHKKGHKTSGFHNVYHKDEYKKDTSFYDNEHVGGHEEQYDSENSQHEEAEGGQENVEKLDAGYHENEHEQKEVFLNGHQYGGAQGHDREASGKEHYAENTAFLKNDELEAAKANSDSLHSKNYY